MALPVIFGAMAISAIGSGSYYLWNKWTKKTVVILGRQATGKTTLMTYLQTAKINLDPKVTNQYEDIKKTNDKHLKNLGWKIKLKDTLRDYSGDGKWSKDTLKNADILLYLFKIDEWFIDPSIIEKQIEEDLKNISSFLENKEIPIFIIGTHLDKIKFHFQDAKEKLYFAQDLQNEPFFKNMKSKFKQNKKARIYTHIGSLNTQFDLDEMLKAIYKNLEN